MKSVSNCENGAVGKLITDGLLDQLVSSGINNVVLKFMLVYVKVLKLVSIASSAYHLHFGVEQLTTTNFFLVIIPFSISCSNE